MKLAKAKELLQQELDNPRSVLVPDLNQALFISIEADTFIIFSRVTTPGSVPTLLNGETKE